MSHFYRIFSCIPLLLICLLPFFCKAQVNAVPVNDFSPVFANTAQNDSLLFIKDTRTLLNSLTVYPNPIQEKINISYYVKKDNLISIRIIDLLGNEVLNLLTEKKPQGFYQNAFALNGKIPKGFYFIRISVGSETVMKRISVQ